MDKHKPNIFPKRYDRIKSPDRPIRDDGPYQAGIWDKPDGNTASMYPDKAGLFNDNSPAKRMPMDNDIRQYQEIQDGYFKHNLNPINRAKMANRFQQIELLKDKSKLDLANGQHLEMQNAKFSLRNLENGNPVKVWYPNKNPNGKPRRFAGRIKKSDSVEVYGKNGKSIRFEYRDIDTRNSKIGNVVNIVLKDSWR